MCCLITVAHDRHLASASLLHVNGPLASVTQSSPYLARAAVAEGIGSAGAPVKTDLAVLDAKHWVEMRMGSQVFVSQHASTPYAETGYICGHEQRAYCCAPTQPCHRPLAGWHGRLLVWCSRQHERVAMPDSLARPPASAAASTPSECAAWPSACVAVRRRRLLGAWRAAVCFQASVRGLSR
jgi:hypothetical protein